MLLSCIVIVIPYLGYPLSWALGSWYYAAVLYEHKYFSARKHDTPSNYLDFIEKRWAYYLGFGALKLVRFIYTDELTTTAGALPSLVTCILPFFISNALILLATPLVCLS